MTNEAHSRKLSWQQIQDELADENGLAIVLVEGENSREISVSNNNSICRYLYSSTEFAPRCAEYCGKANEIAHAAGRPVHVKCHANLNFVTVPIEVGEKKISAIVGRAFTKTDDYRCATTRASEGDWQQFPAEDFFSNVLISVSVYDLESVANRFEKLRDKDRQALSKLAEKITVNENETKSPEQSEPEKNTAEQSETEVEESETSQFSSENIKEKEYAVENKIDDDHTDFASESVIAETARWRSVFSTLLEQNYQEAGFSVLGFLAKRFNLESLAWLERNDDSLEIAVAVGDLKERDIQIGLGANDRRLFEAVNKETPLLLRERLESGEQDNAQTLQLFPAAIGNQIRGALIVADEIQAQDAKRHIARFTHSIAPELEILRLRREVEEQEKTQSAARTFNQALREANGEDDWDLITRIAAEIMRAERGSLLALDEQDKTLTVKSAVGRHADIVKREKAEAGKKVASLVLHQGSPLIVEDIRATTIPSAPASFQYRTKSFISFPIIINNRKIGVLNITDKADGEPFDAGDLRVLNSFAPQLAIAIDRATLKQKAVEFEKRSITDALTGLLNRRYLEERLAEEIKRWKRDGLPASFMMIDVDEFKSYNDKFSHPEGDKALKLVGQALKATLRGADVAARYGGEEFSILLPQTALSEALTIGERVRERVENTIFPNRQVTISVGIATCSPELSTVQSLVAAADKSLYKAKSEGRNNVQVYDKIKDKKDEL